MSKALKAVKAERQAWINKGLAIGAVTCRCFLQGMNVEDTMKVLKRKFPKAKSTYSSTAWYRSQLRRWGFNVPDMKEPAPTKPVKKATKKLSAQQTSRAIAKGRERAQRERLNITKAEQAGRAAA